VVQSVVRDGNNGIVSATIKIQQNITLEDLKFGTINIPTSTLDNFPFLKQRFSQHNITQKQEVFNHDCYLGFTPVFKNSFYQDEEHEHRWNFSGTTNITINFSYDA
jgi:hypothetical protein